MEIRRFRQFYQPHDAIISLARRSGCKTALNNDAVRDSGGKQGHHWSLAVPSYAGFTSLSLWLLKVSTLLQKCCRDVVSAVLLNDAAGSH
jgi:hypothetical protein